MTMIARDLPPASAKAMGAAAPAGNGAASSGPEPLGKRLLGWIGRSDAARAVSGATAARQVAGLHAVQQQTLYAEVGAFLFAHQLDLSALNFGCVHDYLSNADRELERAINAELAARGRLSNRWIEAFFAERPRGGISAEALSRNAEKLEHELTQCLAVIERSRGSADAYGNALEAQAQQFGESDQLRVVERMVNLTREMLEHTRQMQSDMAKSARQTRVLRTNLRRAQRAAEIDHLTGLPNRRGFEARLREACDIAQQTGNEVVIALCDIDHFKVINDLHGHDAGDRVLGLVARELSAMATSHCHVARYGGEEFVIIFERRDGQSAAAIVDRARRALAARALVNQETNVPIGQVTFSAGVATVRCPEEPGATLKLADTALYLAKQTGRDRVCLVERNGEIRQLGAAREDGAADLRNVGSQVVARQGRSSEHIMP